MYKFINEAKTPEEEKQLMNIAVMLKMMLSEQQQAQTEKEFEVYRDTSDAEGKGFKPWYRWMIDRVEVKLR